MKPQIAIAACVFELTMSGSDIQLFPVGAFRADDGRPANAPHWYLDEAVARDVIAASTGPNDLVIDYEHQTLNTTANGMPAPAAGWMKGANFYFKPGVGFFAGNVEWIEKAKKMIADREYRYISPVFAYEPGTGKIKRVLSAALTNDPALKGMQEVEAKAAAKFSNDTLEEEHTMNKLLTAIVTALALGADTTEDGAIEALTSFKKKADDQDATIASLRTALDLDGNAELKAVVDAVAALKTDITSKEESIAALKSGEPDPAKYVPIAVVEELKTDMAALKLNQLGKDVDVLIQEGLADGRILPAQEQWARDLGKKDIAALKSYIDTAKPIAGLQRQTDKQHQQLDDKGNVQLSENELAICKSMNMDPKDYAEARKEELQATG